MRQTYTYSSIHFTLCLCLCQILDLDILLCNTVTHLTTLLSSPLKFFSLDDNYLDYMITTQTI